jgi:1-acyl-sn-glycerol-3-phosphate acyltransferase
MMYFADSLLQMKKIFQIILGPVYFIYKLWVGAVFWITLLIFYPVFLVFLRRPSGYPSAFRLKRIWSAVLCTLFFCPVRRTMRSDLPPAPFVIVSNHCSYLDTVFMYRIIAPYFVFMGKGELLNWPLFGKFFKTTDIAVDRQSLRGSFGAWQQAAQAIDRGHCVAIYPEGTIPDDTPKMLPFKNGAFRLAAEKGVPIVCITWRNNYRILKEPSRYFEFSLPQIIDVVVHPPLTGSDPETLRDQARDMIEKSLHHAN